ncbi:MAG: acyl-ACP--UDP-N-acetylglucosamine O-acyltransferase [Candidatus Omnitrophica bacterium]|nr:acyl-ACP--UDP-N-acetylglucosamine O-acyltransferase [Candidatus Omnitrophota bacterium]
MIHPTAIVSDKAQLADGVTVGPYSFVGDNVVMGPGCAVGMHALIEGNTTLGENCRVFTGAVLGSKPQDLKYRDEKTYLEIGSNNVIREYCTFNPGTHEGSKTIVGNDNLFMAYSHVAHDCRVGNGCVFANNATLAGHVVISDKVVIGGLVAIHQFVRVGRLSIIGGCSKVVQDIPPYSTCDGHPARVYGLNLTGLRRAKVSRECIHQLRAVYKILFHSGLSLKNALKETETAVDAPCPEVRQLLDFMTHSERGVTRSCR